LLARNLQEERSIHLDAGFAGGRAMSPRSIAGAFRTEINHMRDERLGTAAATKAARHAERLAWARAQDEARAKRNEHVPEPLRGLLNAISPGVTDA
jgi:hypothetical protein